MWGLAHGPGHRTASATGYVTTGKQPEALGGSNRLPRSGR